MNDKIENPLAFPLQASMGEFGSLQPDSYGMTLRDYFAGQHLTGMLANPNLTTNCFNEVAADCYKMADAMLKERMK